MMLRLLMLSLLLVSASCSEPELRTTYARVLAEWTPGPLARNDTSYFETAKPWRRNLTEQAIREAWVREAFFAVHRVGDPVEPIFAEVQADFPTRCPVVKRGDLNHHAFLGRNDSILAIEERDDLLVDVWVAKFGRVLKGFDAGCPIRDLSP